MIAAAPNVHAITIRHDVPDDAYVALSLRPEYDAVGWLRITSGRDYACSGTLIGDRWVLTAAHCVNSNTINNVSRVVFTDSLGRTHAVSGWIVHERWSRNLVSGWDMALIELAQPITDIRPAELYTRDDEKGRVATMVGYGTTGTGITGNVLPPLTRRAAQNMLDLYGGELDLRFWSSRLVFSDFDDPRFPQGAAFNLWGSDQPLPLEGAVAAGDSGGGTFIDVNGRPYLAAVHSLLFARDFAFDSDYGDGFGSTRVSQFIDWIEGHTGIQAIGPIPEPAGLMALALAAAAVGGLRRHARWPGSRPHEQIPHHRSGLPSFPGPMGNREAKR